MQKFQINFFENQVTKLDLSITYPVYLTAYYL